MTLLVALLVACTVPPSAPNSPPTTPAPVRAPTPTVFANVDSAIGTGNPGAYRFTVVVYSPDAGCEQFANWWEVVDLDGTLLYRRLLEHSHVEEQPFERTGGPVRVDRNQEVIVRAHMNNAGYGGHALRGSVGGGFFPAPDINDQFAATLASAKPQPSECAW